MSGDITIKPNTNSPIESPKLKKPTLNIFQTFKRKQATVETLQTFKVQKLYEQVSPTFQLQEQTFQFLDPDYANLGNQMPSPLSDCSTSEELSPKMSLRIDAPTPGFAPPTFEELSPVRVEESKEILVNEEGMRIKRAVEKMVIARSAQFHWHFDFKTDELVIKFLRERFGNVKLVDTDFGKTFTKIVEVDGVPTFILKKVSLPGNIALKKTAKVQRKLDHVGGKNLAERVDNLFGKKPNLIISQAFTHANYAQREKMVYEMGKNLGIPEVKVIMAGDGLYTLHTFIEIRTHQNPHPYQLLAIYSKLLQGVL